MASQVIYCSRWPHMSPLRVTYEKALEYYMELLEREPENSEVTLNVIQCLLILKRDEEAKDYAKKMDCF